MNQTIGNYISKRDKILFVLMGMFVFSTFTATLCGEILHLPLTLPEPFFIAFLILLKKQLLPVRMDKGLFGFLVIVLILSILISQIASDYSLFAVLSSARGYLYLFLFLAIYKRDNKPSNDALLYISFGTLIGWTIACVMAFRTLLANPSDPAQTYGNMIAVALFISIATLNKKWKLLVIGLVLLMLISFMSGIRRVILVILAAGVLSILIYYIRKKLPIFKVVIVAILVAFPLYLIIPYVGRYAEENVPILYYRLFTKTEESLRGESGESDEYRVNSFKKFREEWITYLLPQGMVSNQYIEDNKTGIYMDFPFLALSHIFSLPVALFLFIFFFVKAYKSYLLYRVTGDTSPGVFAIVAFIMLMLLFVEGSFLVHPFTTPFSGLCLGKAILYAREYDAKKWKCRKVLNNVPIAR